MLDGEAVDGESFFDEDGDEMLAYELNNDGN
jgi:hypothetical protein